MVGAVGELRAVCPSLKLREAANEARAWDGTRVDSVDSGKFAKSFDFGLTAGDFTT